MRFVFHDPSENGRRKPERHLADVDIVFDTAEGPLAGLRLVGTALWSQEEQGISVTLPSRKVEPTSGAGKEWFYEFLRAEDNDGARIKRLKADIISAYQQHTTAQVARG